MDCKLSTDIFLKWISVALLGIAFTFAVYMKAAPAPSNDSSKNRHDPIETGERRVFLEPKHESRPIPIKNYYSIKPIYVSGDGKILGYQLFPGEDSANFYANGFKVGDIVTQVNGIPLSSKKHGIRVLRTLVKSDTADVMVLRNGIEIELLFLLNFTK